MFAQTTRGIDLERPEGLDTEKFGYCPNLMYKSESGFLRTMLCLWQNDLPRRKKMKKMKEREKEKKLV